MKVSPWIRWLGLSAMLTGAVFGQAFSRAEPLSPIPWPQAALAKQTEQRNEVQLEVRIDADGSTEFSLLRGSGDEEWDEVLLERLCDWRWKPATQDGTAVDSVVRIKLIVKKI